MISPREAQRRIGEHLAGFPAEVADAYLAFATRGDLASLDVVVLGVLHFYLSNRPDAPLAALPGSTRLREDLGVDSLTMIDMAFLAESLFALKLADDELSRIATLDELRDHFRQRVGPTCGLEA